MLSLVVMLFYAFIHDDLKDFSLFPIESHQWLESRDQAINLCEGKKERRESMQESSHLSVYCKMYIARDAAQSDHIQERRKS